MVCSNSCGTYFWSNIHSGPMLVCFGPMLHLFPANISSHFFSLVLTSPHQNIWLDLNFQGWTGSCDGPSISDASACSCQLASAQAQGEHHHHHHHGHQSHHWSNYAQRFRDTFSLLAWGCQVWPPWPTLSSQLSSSRRSGSCSPRRGSMAMWSTLSLPYVSMKKMSLRLSSFPLKYSPTYLMHGVSRQLCRLHDAWTRRWQRPRWLDLKKSGFYPFFIGLEKIRFSPFFIGLEKIGFYTFS